MKKIRNAKLFIFLNIFALVLSLMLTPVYAGVIKVKYNATNKNPAPKTYVKVAPKKKNLVTELAELIYFAFVSEVVDLNPDDIGVFLDDSCLERLEDSHMRSWCVSHGYKKVSKDLARLIDALILINYCNERHSAENGTYYETCNNVLWESFSKSQSVVLGIFRASNTLKQEVKLRGIGGPVDRKIEYLADEMRAFV